jgi:hypothetical protein
MEASYRCAINRYYPTLEEQDIVGNFMVAKNDCHLQHAMEFVQLNHHDTDYDGLKCIAFYVSFHIAYKLNLHLYVKYVLYCY